MFENEKCKVVFLLTKIDGKKRNDELGLTDKHYEDEELATKWHNHLVEVLSSDSHNKECEELTDKAYKELESLYINLCW